MYKQQNIHSLALVTENSILLKQQYFYLNSLSFGFAFRRIFSTLMALGSVRLQNTVLEMPCCMQAMKPTLTQ